MNIFKSLSQGNGRISETNITSFLSYLLDSSNELNNAFIVLFLELIDENTPAGNLMSNLNLQQRTLREKIIEFSKRYSVLSEPEYPINDREQIVDVFLKIMRKDEEDVVYILIENKIKKEANNPKQALNQFTKFEGSEDCNDGVPIYSVLISIDNERFADMHKHALTVNEKSAWLKWTNHKNPEKSLVTALRNLIRYEHEAEIQPIDPNSQFIIKSFIDYIITEYSFKESGQKNFSFNGFDVVSTATVNLNKKSLSIKRFANKMIRIFDENDNMVAGDVKPMLREINEEYELGVSLYFPGGRKKNTQYLGRDIINELNKSAEK